MEKHNFAVLTKEDSHILFNISENLDKIYKDIAKSNAVAYIFSIAAENFLKSNLLFNSEFLFNAASVIDDYTFRANENMRETYEQFMHLYECKIRSVFEQTE